VPRLLAALAGKKVIGASAGHSHTAAWTEEGELFTFGYGAYGQLGHGGQQTELVPRLVAALAGNKVIGASASSSHTPGRSRTVVWTEAGELFTFGDGHYGALGHGGTQNELVPRLVDALVGKKVVGAAAGQYHTAVWTDEGELFTFGNGDHGKLGHGGQQTELVPRLVEAMAGEKVIGAAAGSGHTAVCIEAGELFTFGQGGFGRLGHGGTHTALVPGLVEALAEV
jgi:E3 ubiquitin-protein ligase HERC2